MPKRKADDILGLRSFFKEIKPLNVIMIFAAGIINAFGITIFLYPVKLYDSGVSGISMLLSQLTPDELSLSLFLVVLNVPIFLYGLKTQGRAFTFYAVLAVAVYSLFAHLITDVFPIDVSFASPLAGQDLLLCALFGGAVSGLGSGIAIRFGGAMDGIEVLAVIFAKRLGITVGTFCMIHNVILYIICGIVFNSWILPLYSIVTYMAALNTVDYVVEGFDRAKGAMIITTKPKEICESLSEQFGIGMTTVQATGGYSNTPKTMVYFVCSRFHVTRMRNIVNSIDPKAYISITEVSDIFSSNHNE